MYTIAKKWHFHAGHRLLGLAQGHKCSRLHGHTYSIEVCLGSAAVDGTGMVMDYAEMTELVSPYLEKWDHRTFLRADDPLVGALRKVGEGESVTVLGDNPTAEVLARILFDGLQFQLHQMQNPGGGFDPESMIQLLWVEVKESESSMARIQGRGV